MPATRLLAILALGVLACSSPTSSTTPPPPPPSVTDVSVAPSALTFQALGSTKTLTATLTPSTSTAAITWQSVNPAIASVSGSGATVTITAVAAGTTTIRATAGGVTGTATVAVNLVAGVVRSVIVSPNAPSVLAGATRQLTATVDADAGLSTAVTWSTSSGTIATVSTAGLVTAKIPGTVTITATSVSNPQITGTATVTVTAPQLRAITLTPNSWSMTEVAERTLAPTFDADAGANTALTWSSSNTAVATVSSSGVVTGVTVGTATITATSVAQTSIKGTATANITVLPPLVNYVAQPTPVPSSSIYGVMYGTWSITNGSAWAAGVPGLTTNRMLRYTAGAWAPVTALPAGFPTSLVAIGGFGAKAWVGTTNGRIAELISGTTWTEMTSPFSGQLLRIVGLSTTSAVALTTSQVGTLASGTWSVLTAPGITVADIDATATNNIMLGGSAGTSPRVSRWNGSSWLPLTNPPFTGAVTAITFDGTTTVAASNKGESAVFTSNSWTTVQLPASKAGITGEYIVSMVRCGGQVYAATASGGRVFRLTGTSWTVIANYSVANTPSTYVRVSCGADNVLRSTGSYGGIARYTGSAWVTELSSPQVYRTAISHKSLAFALVGSTEIMKWDGSAWSIEFSDPTTAGEVINETFPAISAAPDGTVMFTAGDGMTPRGIYRRTPAGAWSFSAWPQRCSSVYAGSSNFGLAVGPTCSIRWNGSSWVATNAMPFPTPGWVDGSGTFALATGSNGSASASAKWDGTNWVSLPTPNIGPLGWLDVYSPTLAYALGQNNLLRWDGTQWNIMALPRNPGSDYVISVIVARPTEVYVTYNSSPSYYRYNGTTWQSHTPTWSGIDFSAGPTFFSISAIPGFGIWGTIGGVLMHAKTSD